MTRVALDSNILIYAEMEPDSDKGKLSAALILRAARDGVIPVQVLGEYLRFVQRRIPAVFPQAIRQIAVYQDVFITPPTSLDILDLASVLARTHGMQLWDAIVCAASAQSGAKALLTEDMQDGRILEGLRLINPFLSANTGTIDALLADG
jgi:predicted nucleic acid-binding protein